MLFANFMNTLLLSMCILLVSTQAGTIPKTTPCTCAQILNQDDCILVSTCDWVNTVCQVKVLTTESYCSNSNPCPTSAGCAMVDKKCTHFTGCTAYLQTTDELCKAISLKCTSDGTKCINMQVSCEVYPNKIGCLKDTTGKYCFWNETAKLCQSASLCTHLPTTLKTDAECRAQLPICTTKQDGGCVNSGNDCKDQTQFGCVTNSSQTQKCFWEGNACKDYTCENAAKTLVTVDVCKAFLSTCTLANTGLGCMTIPQGCADYKIQAQCYKSANSVCIWIGESCKDYTCVSAPDTYTSDAQCRSYKTTCTVDSDLKGCLSEAAECTVYTLADQCITTSTGAPCYWNGTKCVAQTCANAVLTVYSISECFKYAPQCTATSDNTACTNKLCSLIKTVDTCNSDYQNNQCQWSGVCTKRTCQLATTLNITHSDCQTWLNTCTVADTGKGCKELVPLCATYTKESQCNLTSTGVRCKWQTNTCVDRTCANAPTTLRNDQDCTDFLPSCTINATYAGCVVRSDKCDGLTSGQCTKTSTGALCYWSRQDPLNLKCVARSCSIVQLTTHKACEDFLSTCTLNATGVGCITKLDTCSLYTKTQHCVSTLTNVKCIWNLKSSPPACETRTCANADQVTSAAECSNHLSTCTTNTGKTACISKVSSCGGYTADFQCTVTLTGVQCIWYATLCKTKTCDLAPNTYTTHAQCQAFHTSCTTNSKGCVAMTTCALSKKAQCETATDGACAIQPGCQVTSCDDAPTTYTTDAQCKSFLKTCTTNGAGCITRGNCVDAYVEGGCVTNSTGGVCSWVNGRCFDFGCGSAPSKYGTDSECSFYRKGCTANLSGGCIQKSTCSEAKLQAACITDIKGQSCEFSLQGCRDKICTDLAGTTHAVCKAQNPTCSTDGTRCVDQSKCQDKVRAVACIEGSDGPCLWVKDKCYPYTDCSSIKEVTDAKCKLVSANCTTNGTNCVSIDTCALTSTAGCITGTDGQCVLAPPALSAAAKCTLFSTCTSIFYATHLQCQGAHPKCTTNLVSCIDLGDCSLYTTEQGCVIDSKQAKCFWNTTKKSCANLACGDMGFGTDALCVGALSTCTTDGVKCIDRKECSTYNDVSCSLAMGSKGKCFYDPTKKVCREATCSDIVKCTDLPNCIDTGVVCVPKATCATYTSEKSCKYGGTDGVCIWALEKAIGTCKLMTKCSDASEDSVACNSKSWICQWSTNSDGRTVCGEHTCATKAKTSSCSPILTFDQKEYQICALVSSVCTAQDLSNLVSANCFVATGYTYGFDQKAGLCSVCNAKTDTVDPGTDGGSTTDPVTTNQSILQVAILFILIAMISLL